MTLYTCRSPYTSSRPLSIADLNWIYNDCSLLLRENDLVPMVVYMYMTCIYQYYYHARCVFLEMPENIPSYPYKLQLSFWAAAISCLKSIYKWRYLWLITLPEEKKRMGLKFPECDRCLQGTFPGLSWQYRGYSGILRFPFANPLRLVADAQTFPESYHSFYRCCRRNRLYQYWHRKQ